MSVLKICPTCSTEYPANERFCPRDGTALRSQGGGSDLVGSIIAERYHVLKKLGEGGMGQVYLAEHVKMGRKSAVKVMNPGMVNDADAISRFNREAANASRINHPNVAGIYDFGETPDGLIYLAMEFVEGEPLTSIIASQGALGPGRAAEITRQAAGALSVAHDMGIVHRDLKPDNIMVGSTRDGADCVKIVDFGIAKAAGSDAQKVTRTGLVIGTPEYMSPEQLAGDKLDGRSDIYSLALVTFNMLTGKLPFPGETAQEAMIMRLTDEPKTLAEMRPDVPWTPTVQGVLDRALARLPKDRYQSASQFGGELWEAVDEMTRALARGTLVMNAPPAGGGATVLTPSPSAAGRTAAQSSVPATNIAPVAATPGLPASAPTAARSRAPLLAGGGVVAAAAVGAVLLMGRGRDQPARAQGDSARAAPAETVASRGGAAPEGGVGAPSHSHPAGGAPSRAVPLAATLTPGAGAGEGAASGLASRISALADQVASDDPRAREQAMAAARTLQKKASGPDRVGLRYIEALGYGMQNDTAQACPILREIRGPSARTPYEGDIANLLRSSCS